MENSAGAGGTIGRSIEELATLYERLGRHPRLGVCLDSCHLYVSGVDVTDPAALDALPRRGRRLDRARPAARAARQRLRRAARLEPRPAREHRRGAARREARRLPRQPAAAGTARRARDRRPGQPRARTRTRSARRRRCAHALSLGDPRRGDARAGELLRALRRAAGARARAARRTTGSRSARPASCSARSASACCFTLLPWGLLADRLERAVGDRDRAHGARACARSSPADALVLLRSSAALVAAGALGASVNAASGRAVMGVVPRRRARARARRSARRRSRSAARAAAAGLPWLALAGGTRLAFLVLGCSCIGGAVVAAASSAARRHAGAGARRTSTAPMRDPRMWLLGLGSGFYLTAQIGDHRLRRPVPPRAPRCLARVRRRAPRRRSTCSAIGARIAVGPLVRPRCARGSRPLRAIGVALAVATGDRRRAHRRAARAARSRRSSSPACCQHGVERARVSRRRRRPPAPAQRRRARLPADAARRRRRRRAAGVRRDRDAARGGSRSRSPPLGPAARRARCSGRCRNLAKPREHAERRRSRRQLVELRVDAAELTRAMLEARLDLRRGTSAAGRAVARTAPKPFAPALRRAQHVDVDLRLEHLLHAAHERVPVLLVRVDERARALRGTPTGRRPSRSAPRSAGTRPRPGAGAGAWAARARSSHHIVRAVSAAAARLDRSPVWCLRNGVATHPRAPGDRQHVHLRERLEVRLGPRRRRRR